MSGALPRGGGRRGRCRLGFGEAGNGDPGADPELSRGRSGGGCSHMGMEVSELSAVERGREEGRAESMFKEPGCEFFGGSQGE